MPAFSSGGIIWTAMKPENLNFEGQSWDNLAFQPGGYWRLIVLAFIVRAFFNYIQSVMWNHIYTHMTHF